MRLLLRPAAQVTLGGLTCGGTLGRRLKGGRVRVIGLVTRAASAQTRVCMSVRVSGETYSDERERSESVRTRLVRASAWAREGVVRTATSSGIQCIRSPRADTAQGARPTCGARGARACSRSGGGWRHDRAHTRSIRICSLRPGRRRAWSRSRTTHATNTSACRSTASPDRSPGTRRLMARTRIRIAGPCPF